MYIVFEFFWVFVADAVAMLRWKFEAPVLTKIVRSKTGNLDYVNSG